MGIELLSDARTAALRSQPLTYDAVGQSVDRPPPGYAYFSRTRRLPASARFDRVGKELMSWQVQARSGLRLAASSLEVEIDAVVIMRFGVGRFSLEIPCRVVKVFDDPHRRGFCYGTLSGHPESGEEAFVVERQSDGTSTFTIAAFSRHATALARLGGPITTRVQHQITNRYLHALD